MVKLIKKLKEKILKAIIISVFSFYTNKNWTKYFYKKQRLERTLKETFEQKSI